MIWLRRENIQMNYGNKKTPIDGAAFYKELD